MEMNGVRDQDRLDEASNFVVYKARILSVLDRNHLTHFALRIIAIPVDPVDNNKYKDAMARAKSIILNGVKDHVVPHITEKNTANEMWEALKKLYQHTSVQRKMLLENQLRSYQMQKGEQINTFLSRLKEIRDQLTSIGAMPDQELMVRTALNVVSEDWGVFVQSILRKATLPDWEEMWAALCQEEIIRLSKARSSGKGIRIKEEAEDDALAFKGKQEKQKKKDLSKVKCFNCGELGHYVSQCPRKKTKGGASKGKEGSGDR